MLTSAIVLSGAIQSLKTLWCTYKSWTKLCFVRFVSMHLHLMHVRASASRASAVSTLKKCLFCSCTCTLLTNRKAICKWCTCTYVHQVQVHRYKSWTKLCFVRFVSAPQTLKGLYRYFALAHKGLRCIQNKWCTYVQVHSYKSSICKCITKFSNFVPPQGACLQKCLLC